MFTFTSLKEFCQRSPEYIGVEPEMPKGKGKGKGKSWSIADASSLHSDVQLLLWNDNLSFTFHPVDTNAAVTKEWDTNTMGRFDCRNEKCSSRGWGSKKIPITIRLYAANRYNVRVYYQRCQRCDWVGELELDGDAYAETVAYRLKMWSGVQVERRQHSGQSKGPHLSKYCEGCKHGHCKESTQSQSYL